MIGDYDINYISNYSLRNLISVVPQQIDLFSGNVIENIALGEDFPNVQRVLSITKDLGILSFVEKLPNGFQTYLGENGALLSGGQKQRIAIARAVCRKPEFYIFDDSFSALDYKTDRILRSALKKESAGITNLIVAQRIGTIMDADKILVLEEGRIIGSGTHKELLHSCSVYKEIAMSQLSQEELIS